jgi:apolipoprotein N-acyltransferase
VPRLRGRTPYTTVGDLFATACAALTAAALASTFRRRSARAR